MIVLALGAAGAIAAAAVAATGSKAAAGGGGGTTSRTATVERGVVQTTVSGSGNLVARHDRELAFSTAGTIKRVFVSEGDKVAAGQVLARLKTSAGATKHLRAPFAGTIGSVGVSVGETVGASGATTAFELVSLKSYDLTVSLSESDIAKVKKGQPATVTVAATGDVLAARVEHFSLLPTSSSSSSDAASSSSSTSYAVTLRLTQTAGGLKPGMGASADLVTSETTGLTVPTAALHGNAVTVVRDGEHVVVQNGSGN